MNSMHGFWVALAERAGDSWFHARWWPYWDAGIPFEFTYAPLIPARTALWSSVGGISHALALQRITGIVYCLAPLTLFAMSWLLTRAPGYSFIAALFYSLTSPTQLIVPDSAFSLKNIWEARRLYLVAVWDDTPHLAALALLPLVIVFLCFSIEKRRFVYYAVTAVLIALTTWASIFGPAIITLAALCLLFVTPRRDFKRNLTVTVLIGGYALALSLPFLPPSLMLAIPKASRQVEGGWTLASIAALALAGIGWLALRRFMLTRVIDWRVRFFALFAFVTASIPLTAAYLHWQFVPQPDRYKLEMELALPLVLIFGTRRWFERAWPPLRVVLVLVLLAAAAGQIVHHRRIAKDFLRPATVTQSIEYRVSRWVDQNLPGVRVMLPGSIAQWANAFTEIQQFTGESWSTAYNQAQQRGFAAVKYGGEPRASLAWLREVGIGAIVVPGPNSPEFWKPFQVPSKFEGHLPVLWREDDTTIYRIPQLTSSLAHAVPENALVKETPAGPGDIQRIEQYLAALDDPSLPLADFRWEGRNRIRIRSAPSAAQVISIQVSYHPGWRANIAGQPREVRRDGLGLMWLKPECSGPCEVQLDYDGGWELRICRYIGFSAAAGLFLIPFIAKSCRVAWPGTKKAVLTVLTLCR